MEKKTHNIMISVLFMQEDCCWVAQGLEYDITAQGNSLSEATKAFEKTMVGQIILDLKGKLKPLSGIEEAPKMYWDMFETSERLKNKKRFSIPKTAMPGFMIDAIAKDRRIAA